MARPAMAMCAAIVCAAFTGSAVATPPAPVLRRTQVKKSLWFLYGERMEWSLQWRGAEGGRARLAVGDLNLADGKRLVAVRADAQTTGLARSLKELTEDVSSVLDIDSTYPIYSETKGTEGKKKIHAIVARKSHGDAPTADVSVERNGNKSSGEQSLHKKAHDVLSALAFMRSLPSLKEGTSRWFVVFNGLKTWRVTGHYKGREVRQTALGEIEVFRIEGTAVRSGGDGVPVAGKTPKAFVMYFSADRKRVPVLIQTDTDYGEVTMTLSQYAGR